MRVFKGHSKDPKQHDRWFAERTLEALAKRGMNPNGRQCIGFKIPVVFRESVNSPDNAYVADLYEQVAFLGDLRRQIAELPDGATARLHVGRSPS